MKSWLATLMLFTAAAVGAAELPPWSASEHRDHPHVGQILDTHSGQWLSPTELVERLQEQPYVIVGEKHDNPDHHALQLWLLEQLRQRREQASLLLEMLVPAQQEAVDEVRRLPSLPDDKQLQATLRWDPGWPWELYGSVGRWGLLSPDKLIAANLDRDEIGELYRKPAPSFSDYSETARQRLEQTIIEAHCGQLPSEQVPAMLSIQHARDRRMARTLAAAPTPALLIAGSFHARRDLGAPLHWDKSASLAVLLLVEAGQEAEALPGPNQADYVWLTPALPAEDYCKDW